MARSTLQVLKDFMTMVQRFEDRAVDALRPVRFELGLSKYAEGSVLIKMGETHVLCNASVLDKVPSFLRGQGQGWVTAEYSMLPRSTHTRSDREAVRGKQSGRTQEIQRLIGRSLRAAFDLSALGERTIHVDCDVIQADGGTRCASITGAWLAAALAVAHLKRNEHIAADKKVLLSQVAAVSVGLSQGQVLLDLDYVEDSSCGADVNVVLSSAVHAVEEINMIEVQGTAEGQVFSRAQLNQLLDYAELGAKALMQAQRQILADNQTQY